MVHKGIYTIAFNLLKKIKLNGEKPIYITGHSIGGAISLMYGAMLYEKGLSPVIYSFGMPPVVNNAFLAKYKDLKHHRFFHIFDPIPSLSKPTIQVFKTQMEFKDFKSAKKTISNMIDTIQNIPDKYRHHGYHKRINIELAKLQNAVRNSLFFQTTTLYFDYHKINNYLKAIQLAKPVNTNSKTNDILYTTDTTPERSIEIIPSITQGTIPLEVEFFVDTAGYDIDLFYFNFGGKEVLKQDLPNNKISHTFKTEGKHKVKISLKDKYGNMVETELVVVTRQPTFQEYQNAFGKEFMEFMKRYR